MPALIRTTKKGTVGIYDCEAKKWHLTLRLFIKRKRKCSRHSKSLTCDNERRLNGTVRWNYDLLLGDRVKVTLSPFIQLNCFEIQAHV